MYVVCFSVWFGFILFLLGCFLDWFEVGFAKGFARFCKGFCKTWLQNFCKGFCECVRVCGCACFERWLGVLRVARCAVFRFRFCFRSCGFV